MHSSLVVAALESVVIPEGVTRIGEMAFLGATDFARWVMPEGVNDIGRHAFRNCTSLSSLVIPDSVTRIGEDTFRGCSRLRGIFAVKRLKINFRDQDSTWSMLCILCYRA